MSPSPALPSVGAVGCALPPHYADQESLIASLRAIWSREHFNLERLEDLHRSVLVKGRYLALPVEQYAELTAFHSRNDAFIEVAQTLGQKAIETALAGAGLTARDIDHLFFVTVTGIAVPSIDARLVNRMGLRPDMKRTPIFGLGCLAGAAGLARATDYLRAFPDEIAVLLSVELCSLTLQREDVSVANIIASGLFGDGAAAVVLFGANRKPPERTPRVLATRSVFFPETERIMGWDVVEGGFKVVLSPKVPALVREQLRPAMSAFLEQQGLGMEDIRHWIAHTGGPKVLKAMEEALELPADALARSYTSLAETGNLSSASVLFVLSELLAAKEGKPGEYGILMAMGPGFCAELVLLQW